MCGIAGIFSNKSIDRAEQRIGKMLDSIKYRGPNNSSYEILNDRCVLGHARLSIIDLSSVANQPMTSNDGNFVIAFNGEIFNFQEIKSELDYSFKTNGDTEVILASIQEKGLDWFLSKANGMFAFAIYDKKNEQLTIVRDRFSIKPLFYYKDDENFIFGSEIKCLLNSGFVEAIFNESAVDEYLGNRMVREPFTFFENIYQVNGGEYMVIDKDLNVTTKKYYELPRQNFDTEYNEEEIIKETTAEVEKALKRWTISDVKVGAYLSGGVDSSLTSAIMASDENLKDKLHTYTIGFEDNNEFEYSKIVADKYNIDHKNILINYDDYVKEWDRLITYNDAPLAVPNEIPLAIMSTELAKDITVVISGEGADELFGGYGRIYRLPFDYKNHQYSGSFYENLTKKYEYVPRELRDKYLLTNFEYRKYFDDKISGEFENYSNEENIFRFFQTYHIKGLLKRVDMTTMQASVEARPPFLDHELIEFVNTKVPYELKLKWVSKEAEEEAKGLESNNYSENLDVPKYILKKVSEKYLPNEIIYRKKVGFPVPLTEWLPNIGEIAKAELKDSQWLKGDKIDELIDESKSNAKAGQIVWMFINIEMFRKKYFNKEWRY
ncbi:MAG: asparagine synthase (glutamine-hydrolyzing) [Candidatus Saccharibacteria bacterium]|nr:asparagine synthase (glutamine-hydrolyzing) [Candidatus Saccharibacteria bacterium]